MGKSVAFLLSACVFLSSLSAACADESYKEKQMKKLGAKVTESVNNKGEKTKHIEFPGGVTIDESPAGSVGMDTSGHGAILCNREIFMEIRNRLALCYGEKNPEKNESRKIKNVIAWLDDAITKLDQFVVENSLHPVTMEGLREAEKNQRDALKNTPDVCKQDSDSIDAFVDQLEKNSITLGTHLETMLSVPRPPVLNPCM